MYSNSCLKETPNFCRSFVYYEYNKYNLELFYSNYCNILITYGVHFKATFHLPVQFGFMEDV